MKNIRLFSFIVFLFVTFAKCDGDETKRINDSKIPSTFQGKVIAIKDGDSFKVLLHKSEKNIRLAYIDCPEKGQPYGNNAKHYASMLCFGKTVIVQNEGKTDMYGRIIGEVILQDGTNVNKELVKNGLAWHYKKYSIDESYSKLEESARAQKIGLWSEGQNPIAPWEWRK